VFWVILVKILEAIAWPIAGVVYLYTKTFED